VEGLEPDSRAGECVPGPPPELASPARLAVEPIVEEVLESIPLGVTAEGLVVPGACMCIESGAFETVWKPGFLPVESNPIGGTDSRPTSMASSTEGNVPSVGSRASAAKASVA